MSNKTAAALAVGTLLLGLITGRALATDGGGQQAEQAKPPASTSNQLVNTDHTKTGAVNAATAYEQALGESLLATPKEREKLIDSISSKEMRQEIIESQQKGYSVLDQVLGSPEDREKSVVRGAPLGYRVVSYSEDNARVEIWSATIVGKPGVGTGPGAGFATTSTDLVWERGGWRLAGPPQLEDGPTPALLGTPSSGDVLAGQVNTLKRFDHVAR